MKLELSLRLLLLGLVFSLAGCASNATSQPTATPTLRSGELTAFPSRTPTGTQPVTSTPAASFTPLPTATATPRTHVVKAGEDMTGIALRYRVSLDTLKSANPKIDPRAMPIGTVLIIPPGQVPPGAPTETSVAPTPVSVKLSPPRCLAASSGGATCFLVASNPTNGAFENVAVTIRLVDASGKQIASQVAGTVLDLLSAGGSLPVDVFFPGPLPSSYTTSGALSRALPATEGEKRYLSVKLEAQRTEILPGALAAEVSAEAVSTANQQATNVWVAAIAYDAAGGVIGVRRWESSAPLATGGRMPFVVRVYSAGPPIIRVELLVQARK